MPAGRLALLLLVAGPAAGQNATRLANDEPEIRVDARGRNGVCDVLTFTPDGHTLLAAGEDKVVHRFAVGPRGLAADRPAMTWNTFREQRGSIYALAVDAAHNRVAVAGFGKLDADVSVLDLRTGAVVDALPYPAEANGDRSAQARQAVWALAFSPDGKELAAGDDVGNVWVWAVGSKDKARLAHEGGLGQPTVESRVVWVGWVNAKLAFARRDGGVYEAGGKVVLHRFAKLGKADRVTASADGRVLAARPHKGG